MVKDYFSDIDTNEEPRKIRTESEEMHSEDNSVSEKSIRNISVSPRRSAMSQRMPPPDTRMRQETPTPRRGFLKSRWLMWGILMVAILALITLALTFILGGTTAITVTPRVQQITFDPSTQFTAYPSTDSTATGIVYTAHNLNLEESKTVAANGVEKAEDRASGTITVFNAYSDKPQRLIKNTRFESPTGLVYRIPASIEVPGKKGATPGQITVTVFADQAGAQYNVGPTDKFTVPGLKSTAEMYNGIYARSSAAFTGGFIGEKPAILPASLEAARAELRSILQSKVQESIAGVQGFAFASLAKIEYESAPTIADPAGGAKITEKARVTIPVFPSDQFAKAIAQAVSADAADSRVSLRPQGQLAAQVSGTLPDIGAAPILFGLSGSALVVWDVDTDAVKQALAGKEQSAFKPIIANFLGIRDATAKPPFWTSTFPSADKIEITLVDPTTAQ